MFDIPKALVLLCALTTTSVTHAQQADAVDTPSALDQTVPVADDDAASVVDEGIPDEQRLMIEFERYRRLIDEGAMDEADTSAKRIVEMAIRIYGPQSHETATALNNLAVVQHKNGQYDPAIQNFESSIKIIETLEDRLNAQLVNPLKGLGAAQLGGGRPDLAVDSLNRATHITHVNDGPHNIEQVEILESLAESTLRMGDMDGARSLLDRIHALNVRHFENDELALIPSLMRRADWQHRAGYYNDERATYRRAIRIVEAKLGKDDPQLILPLTKLGESFYFIDMSRGNTQQQGIVATGEVYFKRAMRIAERSEEIGWSELVDIKLSLGDYYVYVEAHNRARKVYREMWNFLSTDEERLAVRHDLLERPVVLMQETLPKYAVSGGPPGESDETYVTGTIRVDYTVSKRGRVRNLRTEAIPQQFTEMQRVVHREIRRRVFRPMLVEAEPQESAALVFEHSFYYRQADLDKLLQQQQPVSQTAKEPSET